MTRAERAQALEAMMLGLPALESRLGADPERPRAIEQQGVEPVIGEGAGVAGIVAQVLDAARCGLENVDTRVEGSDPHAIVGIHEQGVDGVAGERAAVFGIVAVDDEVVRGALPAREAPVLDGDPQIVVTILDDGLDVVARQPSARSASRCPGSSTPLAIGVSPNAWAIAMPAWHTLRDWVSRRSPVTQARSSCRPQSGARASSSSEPMPRATSSTTTRAPSCARS